MHRLALMLSFALTLSATPITLTSGGSGEWNSSGNPTISIVPHPAWATALPGSTWVSFDQTGLFHAFNPVQNGTIFSFFEAITTNGPMIGTLSVMADDSVAVYLNGNLLLPEAPMNGNQYSHCSDFPTGCLASTMSTITGINLAAGLNIFRFDVSQRNGQAFGLDYAGTFDSRPAETPEPSTAELAVFGVGILLVIYFGGRSGIRRVPR